MPLYEHVFLARQDVSNQQIETLTKELQSVLESQGGKVVRSEAWGLRPLAFKIKKNRKAHYTMLNIDAPAAAVAEMERQMSLSTDIIRYMTLRVEAHENEPSAMMRKSDRDDRRGGRRGRDGERGGRDGGRDRDGGGGRDRDGGRPPRRFDRSDDE